MIPFIVSNARHWPGFALQTLGQDIVKVTMVAKYIYFKGSSSPLECELNFASSVDSISPDT